METLEFILPAYWASALINGDFSGYSDSEENEINQWLKETKPGYCVDCSDESWFAHFNDANSLGGDVLTFTFHNHFGKPLKD